MTYIDKFTSSKAIEIFERLYGQFEGIGLSARALKAFLRFGIIPDAIRQADQKLAYELEMISYEFRKILVRVMKVYRTL